jgi:hypothetical protein
VNDDERRLSVWSESEGFPWANHEWMRYLSDVILDKKGDYPPGFHQAVGKYTDEKFVLRLKIWQELQRWRKYALRNPAFWPRLTITNTHPSCDDRVFISDFNEMLLYAAFHGQDDVLQALCETVRLSKPPPTPEPDSDIESVRAVMKAFTKLFKGGGESDWPLKPEVRAAATEILKKAGLPVPKSRRQWTRIFENAGLAKLHQSRPKSKRA